MPLKQLKGMVSSGVGGWRRNGYSVAIRFMRAAMIRSRKDDLI
jgi:hypothetical protein